MEGNLNDDQLENRVDKAIQPYRQCYYNAVELVYLKERTTVSSRLEHCHGPSGVKNSNAGSIGSRTNRNVISNVNIYG